MKKFVLFLVALCFTMSSYSQNLIGAWESLALGKNGVMMKNVVIFADGYQVSTWYNAKTGKFISTNGGKWSLEGKRVTERIEFDTKNQNVWELRLALKLHLMTGL